MNKHIKGVEWRGFHRDSDDTITARITYLYRKIGTHGADTLSGVHLDFRHKPGFLYRQSAISNYKYASDRLRDQFADFIDNKVNILKASKLIQAVESKGVFNSRPFDIDEACEKLEQLLNEPTP